MNQRPSPHKAKASDEKKSRRWLPLAGLASGVAALVFIIYFVGLETILEPLTKIGFGFFWIVLLNGIRHYLRAVNLWIAVPNEQRSFGVFQAFCARLAGETINTIAFTGPFLGDAAKTSMLEQDASLEHSATAVIIDEIVYYVSSLLLIVAGSILVLYGYSGDLTINAILIALILFTAAVVGSMFWVIRKGITPVAWCIKRTDDRWFMPRALVRRCDRIQEVESNVLDFHAERPRAFTLITGIVLLTHVLSVVEAYLAMKLLGLDIGWTAAFIVESLTKAINFVFFLIPGTVGAYEGGNGLIFKLLGHTAGAGVALALVRRGGILFWTLVGGVILFFRGAKEGAEQVMESEPE